MNKWKAENELFLNNVFGLEDGPQFLFLTSVLFATSSSKHLALFLQPVVQADGAHSSFGKYMLYSAHATTANGNMSPLALGLLFGNDDTKNWSKFWSYVKKIHPCIDSPEVSILTDQYKGSIAAVEKEVKQAAQFICSFHFRQNIIKTLGGGKGSTPLTALWMYNLLCGCDSVAQLKRTRQDTTHKCIHRHLTISQNWKTSVNILQQNVQWETLFACIANQHLQGLNQ